MPEVLYSAHPSMLRSRPLNTLLTWLMMLYGGLLAWQGEQAVPSALRSPALDEPTLKLIGLVIGCLALLRLLVWWIANLADRLEITQDEVIWSHGLLSKEYTEIGMSSVRTLRVSQSLLQRLLNAGDLIIYTAGDLPELVVRGLPDPGRIRALIRPPVRE